jgi:hypothetical protein
VVHVPTIEWIIELWHRPIVAALALTAVTAALLGRRDLHRLRATPS